MPIIQVYMDHIILKCTNDNLCLEFSETINNEFKMSKMG